MRRPPFMFSLLLVVGAVLTAPYAAGVAAPGSASRGSYEVDGVVASAYDVKLALPVDGVVARVAVKPGQTVKAGQALASLNNSQQRVRVDLARIALQQIEADRREGARQPAAARRGRQSGRTQAGHEDQRRRYGDQRARQTLKLAQLRLARRTLTAPVAGVVDRVLISSGQYVAAGQPMVRLVQPHKLFVNVAVPTEKSMGLSVGQKVPVRIARAGGAGSLVGRIVQLSHTVDPKTDTRFARIRLPDEVNALVGAHVSVEAPRRPAAARPDGSSADTPQGP